MAISNNYATNIFAFGKHLELTIDSSNISSRFILTIYSESGKMGVRHNRHPPGFSKFCISIILSCRNAVEDAVNGVLNNLLMYPLHRLEASREVEHLVPNFLRTGVVVFVEVCRNLVVHTFLQVVHCFILSVVSVLLDEI